jgi:hypothetical protein
MEAAAPVLKWIDPEPSSVNEWREFPVAKTTSPLLPTLTTLAEVIDTLPLEDEVLPPEIISTSPPLNEFDEPDTKKRDPPLPEYPLPTLSVILPPPPDTDDPEEIAIDPD